jgi:hypothetical protein
MTGRAGATARAFSCRSTREYRPPSQPGHAPPETCHLSATSASRINSRTPASATWRSTGRALALRHRTPPSAVGARLCCRPTGGVRSGNRRPRLLGELLVYVGSFRRGQPRSAASSAAGAWVGMSGAGSRRHLDSVRSRRWTGRGPMVSKLDVSDPTVETGKDCMSLGLDDREIDVLTRKRPNRVHRVPTCDDDDLDPVADLDGLHLAPRNPSALSRRGLTDVQSIRGTRRPALILQPGPSTDARPSEHCRIRQRRRTAAGRRLSALSPHGACQGRLACATTSGHRG